MGKVKAASKKKAARARAMRFYVESWLHLAVSYDGRKAKVYINGKLVKEGLAI